MNHGLLVIPAKPDVERDAVALAWQSAGGEVLWLDRFRERPDVEPAQVAIYGTESFSLAVAQLLELTLISPRDDLLLRAGDELTKRALRGVSLTEALSGVFPLFVKPLVPKMFRARVWASAGELREECRGSSQTHRSSAPRSSPLPPRRAPGCWAAKP
jgi:hypothetical protein